MNADQHANTRTGKIMIAIGFIFALGLLTLYFQERLDAQRNPNATPQSRSIGDISEVFLLRNNQGHYVASGTINGLPVEFLLDTGATDVAITASLARRANLEFGPRSKAMTANGLVDTWNTSIDVLELGDITLTDVDASIMPDIGDDTILLGMSALRQVEFSQQGNRLTLRYSRN